jgi:hypothetical protein
MGTHPLTMLSCASYLSKKQYDSIAKKLTGWFDLGDGRDDLIIIAEELLHLYLLSYVDIIDLEVDETKGDLTRLCKEDCPSCSWGNPHGIALSESIAYFKRTLDKSGEIQLSAQESETEEC